MNFTREHLIQFKPRHRFFVGIDSDGCVFDSMEPKHKECFCPVTVEVWRLAAISKYVREAWDFVNLYSKDRGCNRFLALYKVFDLLRERAEVGKRGIGVPELRDLKDWTSRESRLGNPALEQEIARNGSEELKRVLEWSHAVNQSVERMVQGVGPFPAARESLRRLQGNADLVVVSSTPGEALIREWQENGLDGLVSVIAGQEIGSKKEHLNMATEGRYPPNHVLMIGDAPGDLRAARANQALFFPIVPGKEDSSWEYFASEVIDLFLSERYESDLEERLIGEFEASLPATPPWKS